MLQASSDRGVLVRLYSDRLGLGIWFTTSCRFLGLCGILARQVSMSPQVSMFWSHLKYWCLIRSLIYHRPQGHCWPNGCNAQDSIVVPPPTNIIEVKKQTKKHRGQNRTLLKCKNKYITCINYNCDSRQLPMAIILLIQLSDWVYGLKHSAIMQKKCKQFYYDTTMVNVCKGCDVHVLCWRNYRGCVIYSEKLAKIKD